MDPLNFLKDTISHGLDDVENWGSDVGNAVTKAASDLFGGGSASTASPTLGTQTAVKPIGTTDLQTQGITQSNPLAVAPTPAPKPFTTTPTPVAAPKPLQTNLVNFAQPLNNQLPGTSGSNSALNRFGNAVAPAVTGAVNSVKQSAKAVPGLAETAAGIVTDNPALEESGMTQLHPAATIARQYAQGIAGEGVRVAKSLGNPGTNTAPVTSQNPVTKFLVGNQPIESYQQTGHNAKGGTAGQIGTVGTQVASDILNAFGLALGVKSGVDTFKPAPADVASATQPGGVLVADGEGKLTHVGMNAQGQVTATDATPKTPEDVASLNQQGKEVVKNGGIIKTTDALNPHQVSPGPEDTNVIEDTKTVQDHKLANDLLTTTTGKQLTQDDFDKILGGGTDVAKPRSMDAERVALETLQKGGTRDEAVKAYQDASEGNVSKRSAKIAVTKAARDAKQALQPNARSTNPEEGLHDFKPVKEGDYTRATIDRNRVNNEADRLNKNVNAALTNLSQADRDNFEDYLEGTKNISKADNPEDVQTAIDAGTRLTDTGNAFDHQVGGSTPHIENYFPAYVDRTDPEAQEALALQTEQDAEEELGPEAWQKMTADERQLYVNNKLGEEQKENPIFEANNYGGYRNKARTFATRAERVKAKIKDVYDDPRDAYTHYTSGLKRAVGTRAFANAAKQADIGNSLGDTDFKEVRYGNGPNDKVTLSAKGAKALRSEDVSIGNNAVSKANATIKKIEISTGVPHAAIIPQQYAGALAAIKGATALLPELSGDALEGVNIDKPEVSNAEFGAQVDSPLHSKELQTGAAEVKGTGSSVKQVVTAPTRFVYNYLLPKFHDELLTALKGYLDKKGVDYDSDEARNYGHQINAALGYAKTKNGVLSQSTFAPTLIKSTAENYGKSFTPDGFIARGAVGGQQIANQLLGLVSKAVSNEILAHTGKNDSNKKEEDKESFWQTVQHELLRPSIYTPFVNSKGENINLNLPGEYQAKLASIPFNKNGTNQFGIESPSEIASNTVQTARDIAAPVVGDTVDAITGSSYNGSKVRNPYAPLGTQIEQTAINLLSNSLPINAQALISKGLYDKLPESLKGAVELSQNKGPTGLGLVSNSAGLSPSADTNTGQGPALTKYYQGQQDGTEYIYAHSGNQATQDANQATYTDILDRQKNDNGQTILLNSAQTAANWSKMAANPTVLGAMQVAEKANGKGNYDPEWDLDPSQLATYARYKSLAPGDPERDVLSQKNPFISTTENASIAWAAKQVFSSTAVAGPGYVAYPNITAEQNNLMNQAAGLSAIPEADRTPQQINQLDALYNNQRLNSAFTAIEDYTNKERTTSLKDGGWGLPPINYIPNESPALSNWANAYETASTSQRDTLRSQDPTMYAAMNQAYENSDLGTLEKQASIAYEGGTPSDGLLSAIYNLGDYDVNKISNANGTSSYSLTRFSPGPISSSGLPLTNAVNGYAPGSASSSSGSQESPLVPLPPRPKRPRKSFTKRVKVQHFRAPHIKKTNAFHTKVSGLSPTQVAKPTSVVRIQA